MDPIANESRPAAPGSVAPTKPDGAGAILELGPGFSQFLRASALRLQASLGQGAEAALFQGARDRLLAPLPAEAARPAPAERPDPRAQNDNRPAAQGERAAGAPTNAPRERSNSRRNDRATDGATDRREAAAQRPTRNLPAQESQAAAADAPMADAAANADPTTADLMPAGGPADPQTPAPALLALAPSGAAIADLASALRPGAAPRPEGAPGLDALAGAADDAIAATPAAGQRTGGQPGLALGLALGHGEGKGAHGPEQALPDDPELDLLARLAPASPAARQQAADLAASLGQGERLAVQVQVLQAVPASGRAGVVAAMVAADGDAQPTAPTPATPGTAAQPVAAPLLPQAVQAIVQAAQPVAANPGGSTPAGTAVADAKAAAPGAAPQPQGPAFQAAGTPAPLPHAERAHAQPVHTPRLPAAASARETFEQTSVQIAKAQAAGSDRITIQLRPESLGRIEVRLDVAQDGRTTAVITADNRDTFDMLQRDSRSLERALQDAGLNTDQGSLSFNLREQTPQQRDGETALAGRGTEGEDAEDGATTPAAQAAATAAAAARSGRIDIRA